MTTRIRPDTLANTAVTAGNYGGTSAIPTFTVDAQGRATFAGNVTTGVITAGAGGDSITVPAIVYNALGQLTAVTNTTIRSGSTSQTGVLQLTDSTSSISTTTAATPASVYATANNYQANVGAAVISLTSSYQANTGAALISAKSYTDTEATNRAANVGAGLITVTGNYQANTGAALIAAKSYTDTAATTAQANTGAARISAISSATATAADAGNLTSGTVPVARLGGTPTFTGINVGTASGASTGEIRLSGDIYIGYSDDRLKTKLGNIDNAIEKILSLSGFYFVPNDTAKELGYGDKQQVGVSAQEVQKVLPEVVAQAPIGQDYLTVQYEKLVPLLIECIKELNSKVEALEKNK